MLRIILVIFFQINFSPKYKNMYNFSEFTIQINEMEPDVAPTDSRYRADMRLFEENKYDEAEILLKKLEDNDKDKTNIEPIWFKRVIDPYLNENIYQSTNEYWLCKEKKDWRKCPKIYDYL